MAGLCALLSPNLVATAGAHELWLSPSSYAPAMGTPISISANVGTGFRGDPKPYAAPRALRWELRTSRVTDLKPLAAHGDLVWARFAPPDLGGCLLDYESGFTDLELPGADFERYLATEGLDAPLAARHRAHQEALPGRERYARCAKTWIAGGDSSRAVKPVGLTLEVVPLGSLERSGRLPVRVLFHGRPLSGALVRAWKQPVGAGAVPRDAAVRDSVPPVFAARTDRSGLVSIDVSPGEWLVGAVHMLPSEDKREADWQSWWASLTFAPAPGTKP
jgi:uncharacterized GH25 family protein